MPSWGGILRELTDLKAKNVPAPYDLVRRKYLATAFQLTKRATILYASKWTQNDPNIPVEMISVSDSDMTGLMEVLHGIREKELDLIIHSPGGSLTAAEAFVKYLRSKFDHIRVIIPHAAMSAASMICCAADEVVMGKHSFLGPTDPQFILNTSLGTRMVPADAILSQFRLAQQECVDPKRLSGWLPMLNQYGPDLLIQCDNAIKLSRDLVKQWLESFMFKGDGEAGDKATKIADWLSSHGNFNSHSRHLARDELQARGLKISSLEKDSHLQDAFLSIFHAATHTFMGSGAVKIIENHQGHAFINQLQVIARDKGQPAANAPSLPPATAPGRIDPPFPKKR